MGNNGYSHSSGAGRFGTSATGTYRAPYKLEPFVNAVIIALTGALAVIVAFFAIRFVRENYKSDSSDFFLLLAGGVCLIIVEALVIAICIVLVRIVGSGYKCSYISDDERFITHEGGNTRTIFFRDVQAVQYVPRSLFGKIRGYEVTILLNGYQEEFAVTSEGFISEKSTPFYIINERVEKIRREEARERYEKQISNLGVADLTARTQPESTGKSSAANRLGQDVAMPGLNLSALAAAVSEQEKSSENSENSDKVNDSYVDERGREQLYNEVIGSGRFKVMCSRKKTVLLAVIAVVTFALTWYFSGMFDHGLIGAFVFGGWRSYAVTLLGIAIIGLMVILFFIGDEYTYRANGREFVVTNKKGGETHIAYENAQSVHYFNTLLGYKVEILTVYGVITYNCIDKRPSIYEKPEKLPFDIITKNIRK